MQSPLTRQSSDFLRAQGIAPPEISEHCCSKRAVSNDNTAEGPSDSKRRRQDEPAPSDAQCAADAPVKPQNEDELVAEIDASMRQHDLLVVSQNPALLRRPLIMALASLLPTPTKFVVLTRADMF